MRVLLVSRELRPFFGGGIGTYAVSMARALVSAGHEVEILTEPHEGLRADAVPGCVVHTVDLDAGRAGVDAYPAWAMRYSMAVLDAAERLAEKRRGGFDLIEFPDYNAEGYFACRAKRTLGLLGSSVLAVRLHSASWLCLEADREERISLEHGFLYHLESAAIAEADLVLSPGRRVLERVRETAARIDRGTHRAMEAIVPLPLDVDEAVRELGEGEETTPRVAEVLFFGKLQHLKGVQDLVAAGLMLLERGVKARFRFIGNDSPTGPFGRSMLEHLKVRVPERHRGSFVFEGARARGRLGAAVRAAVRSGGVCCFPSRWEAFPMVCLEAMALGAPVVCSDAGGLGEIVEDGVSGAVFKAGDVAALAGTLERVLGDTGLRGRLAGAAAARVRALCDPARVVAGVERAVEGVRKGLNAEAKKGLNAEVAESAERSQERVGSSRSSGLPLDASALSAASAFKSGPAVSVVIPHYNLGRFLPEAIESVRGQTFKDLEIVVIDDGSTDPESVAVLDRLGAGVRVVRKTNGGLSSARNLGLREARAEWVLALDADDVMEPTLIEKAMAAAARDPGVAFVSPLASYFEEERSRPTGGWVPLGLDRDLLLVRNIGGVGAGSLLRREAALAVGGYDEWMTSFEDWEFWCRMAAAGYRGTVIPEFLLHYRVRPDSMFRSEAGRAAALHAYILSRHAAMAADGSRVMRILQSLCDPEPGETAKSIIAENVRYRMMDTLNDALKRAGVQRAIKGLTVGVLGIGKKGEPR